MKKFIIPLFFIIFYTINLVAAMDTITISVTFGKHHFYSVQSSETFKWDGNLKIEDGKILSIYKLTYPRWEGTDRFGPSKEVSRKLDKPEWESEIIPHSGDGLEGIRFTVTGNGSSVITLDLLPIKIKFSLSELQDKEFLEYHVGGKYSGQPVSIFLGNDARMRVTRKSYLTSLMKEKKAGEIIIPEDFSGKKVIFCAKYCTIIDPLAAESADFQVKNYGFLPKDNCSIKFQLMAADKNSSNEYIVTNQWMEFEIQIGENVQKVKQYLSFFRGVQKLTDVYVTFPFKEIKESGNKVTIRNLNDKITLMLFRAYINESFASHKPHLAKLPPLPKNPSLAIGYDANTLAAQSGEIDTLINREHSEEIGNYILFRPEYQHMATNEDYIRWAPMLKKYNNKVAILSKPGSFEDSLFAHELGNNYLGIHQHECSNLIYGWGEPDPLEKRINRTLPECKEYYRKRIGSIKVLGQALPVMSMDYESGVNFVFCEPAGHATLLLAASRGAAKAYNKNIWGMHVANHLLIDPADKAMERRQFMLINQGWLYGAGIIYDEEAALYSIHDAPHSYSDSLPYNRRQQYQDLYHFASNINLGEEIVSYGFLQGLYDCPVGGVQANPYTERTKVWGMIGPEKQSWTFDTPERGWELLSDYMPGVWLYPVLQDPKDIRLLLGSSPHGQVDLVPINGKLSNLEKYEMLILPGWNTMTDAIYNNLIEYVKNGGHLILTATQCTNHITRDFLTERKDFNFYNDGDLTALAGIKVGTVGGKINTAEWFDGKTCAVSGLQSLNVTLNGAKAIITDENKNPVMVENKIGKGSVWMLTVGEFWGANQIDLLRKQINERLIKIHQQKCYITGDIEDIDHHVYKTADGSIRVVLLNTDWTEAGNIKKINLHYENFSIPLEIQEGIMTQVLFKEKVAIIFSTPSTIIDNLIVNNEKAAFSAGGVDGATIELISLDKINNISIDGANKPASGNKSEKLNIDFGTKWSKKNFVVSFK
jgi:hypothetical protein